MTRALVLTALDGVSVTDLRLLEEAARFGPVRVLLESDASAVAHRGRPPRFPEAERSYLARSVRWVSEVVGVEAPAPAGALPADHVAEGDLWVMPTAEATGARQDFADDHGLTVARIPDAVLNAVPAHDPAPSRPDPPAADTVLASGCFDLLHSGHIRFFEEAAELGSLYVTVGNDVSVSEFKGPDHPMFPEAERRYMVGAIRHVFEALIATGSGWLDAAPEIARLEPDAWVVNEDGDRAEKRALCAARGMAYHVLTRAPREGLPRRTSTDLRGF